MSSQDVNAWNLDQVIEVETKDGIGKLHCCMGIFGIFLKYNISLSKNVIEILH